MSIHQLLFMELLAHCSVVQSAKWTKLTLGTLMCLPVITALTATHMAANGSVLEVLHARTPHEPLSNNSFGPIAALAQLHQDLVPNR